MFVYTVQKLIKNSVVPQDDDDDWPVTDANAQMTYGS